MTDIEKLKDRASLCVNDPFNYLQIGTPGDVLRYAKIVTPAAVRQLLAALDQMEQERDELRAEVERLRARFEYIEDHATKLGGGRGFSVTFFVPVDHEDIGCGIDAAIEKEAPDSHVIPPPRDAVVETMDHAQLQALGQHQEKP